MTAIRSATMPIRPVNTPRPIKERGEDHRLDVAVAVAERGEVKEAEREREAAREQQEPEAAEEAQRLVGGEAAQDGDRRAQHVAGHAA